MKNLLPRCVLILLASGTVDLVFAQSAKGNVLPAPDLANVSYGPHERQVLDLWRAPSADPTPLVVYIHGGGFRSGSKERVPPALVRGLLAHGISVVAINYRLAPEFVFPAHYLDAARAIAFARAHAAEWNLDPLRFGSSGASAGGGTSLWLAFHDDLAVPDAPDPIRRQSTRLRCVAVSGGQSTYDPRLMAEWVGAAAARHPALLPFYGLTPEESDSPRAHRLFEEAAPITFLTADDPPVYAFYSEPRGPLPADAKDGQGAHHINFGLKLKERMDALGIECIVRHADEGMERDQEFVAFFARHLAPLKAP